MEVPGLPGPQVGLPEFALVVGLGPEPRPFRPGERSSVRAAGGEGPLASLAALHPVPHPWGQAEGTHGCQRACVLSLGLPGAGWEGAPLLGPCRTVRDLPEVASSPGRSPADENASQGRAALPQSRGMEIGPVGPEPGCWERLMEINGPCPGWGSGLGQVALSLMDDSGLGQEAGGGEGLAPPCHRCGS